MSENKWGQKQIRGLVYDLTHLDPFTLDAIPGDLKAATLKVRVSFDSHTFTRE